MRWLALLALLAAWAALLITVVPLVFAGDGEAQQGVASPKTAVRRASHPRRAVSISWGGDITLGSRYGLPPDHAKSLFEAVRPDLKHSDLAIGNLEGTLSVGGASKCGTDDDQCFSFQSPPENATALHWAGFDLMNLANNHAFDFGADGQQQTTTALDEAKVAHSGLPGAITVVRRAGVKLAVVGFAPYPWSNDPRDLGTVRALVRKAAGGADVVVVLAHLGSEGSDQAHTPVGSESLMGEDRGDTRAFAHAAVDAGADLVLGSGPHVLRGMELYRHKLIAYSLGNLAGWHNFSTAGPLAYSGLLTVRLSPRGELRGGRFTSLRLDAAGAPGRDATDTAARTVSSLSEADFPNDPVVIGARGHLRPRP